MRAITDVSRQFDFTINQRVSLHQQGLISDEEFLYLSGFAGVALARIALDTSEIKKI